MPESSPHAPAPEPGPAASTTPPRVPPPLLVLTAIVSIQVGTALASGLFPALGALGTVAWRIAIAALVLLAVVRPRVLVPSRRQVGLLLLFGVVIASMNALFYLAVDRLPLGVVVAVEFLGPLGLGAVMSRRNVERLWVALALLGVALLAPFSGTGYDPVGLAFAAGAGLGWAGFVLLSARVAGAFDGATGLALGMTVAALVLAPLAWSPAGTLLADPTLIAATVAVALLSTAIPFSLEFHALKRLSATAYGVLIALEPAVAAVVGAIMLGERLEARGLAAVVCVTVAALGVTLTRERSRPTR